VDPSGLSASERRASGKVNQFACNPLHVRHKHPAVLGVNVLAAQLIINTSAKIEWMNESH
jgi:hypothetical protein